MNKKIFYIFLIIIIVLIVISGGVLTYKNLGTTKEKSQLLNQPTNNTNNMETYKNSDYGFEIKYPSDWQKNEQVEGVVVAFLSPKKNASDTFQENLNILVQDLSIFPFNQSMTLSEFTNLSVELIKQSIPDSKILESITVNLSGSQAYKVVFTGGQGQYNLKWMQIGIIKDNKAYIISYTAMADKYDGFLETIQKMIDSFTII